MKRLIFHCDDYGLSEATNAAIEESIANGIVRSVSVIANADRTSDCVRLKQRFGDRVSIGLHVNLTARKPLAPANRVESLVDPNGRFFAYPDFRKRILTGRIRTKEIQSEVLQQALELQRHIGEFSHFDTHKHTHVFPQVIGSISRVAEELRVQRVRSNKRFYVSSEQPEVRDLQIRFRKLHKNPLQLLSVGLKRIQTTIIARSGLRSPHGLLTFDPLIPTAEFDAYENTWMRLLDRIPEGTYEMNFHPGGIPAEKRFLQSEKILSAIKSNDISLISYHDI
jgi:predicted glycoside hydrolase/deacetylase ChbG (UPF0249 family)